MLTTTWLLLAVSATSLRGLAEPPRQDNADEKAVAAAKDLLSSEEERRCLAAAELLRLGERAQAALPELISALRETPGELPTILILGQIGEPAVKPLIAFLREGPKMNREAALAALTWIGPSAKEAIPLVRELVTSDDENLVPLAAYALARIDPKSRPEALDILKKGVGATRGRDFVPLLVAWLRPDDAGPALPLMAGALRSQSCMFSEFQRLMGAYCLAELGQAAAPAAPALREALDDRDPVVQVLSAYALAQASPERVSKKGSDPIAVLVKIAKISGQDPDARTLDDLFVLQRQSTPDSQMRLTLASIDALLTREPGNRFPTDYILRWAKRSLQQPQEGLKEWLRDNRLAGGLATEMVWRLDPDTARKSALPRHNPEQK